ncbi:hypothetical protein TWF173_005055 [Orbilia oligospora]|nr:hypothetical protein TWF173_005055 [Orbilia oligospora]
MEYLTSRKVGTKMSYKDILESLKARNINVLDGPFASSESSTLSFEILQMAHKAMITTPKAAKRFAVALNKAQEHWEPVDTENTRMDIGMACEGHINQYAFLTADKTFCNFFEHILNKKNVTVYCVEEKDLGGARE